MQLCLVALMLTALPAAARSEDVRVKELLRKLEERDKVILELLDRVEALERRTGVARPAAGADKASSGALKPDEGPESRFAESSDEVPGKIVVEERDAERALDRALTREGALLLPRGILEVEPGFQYAREENSTPRLFTSGGQLLAGATEVSTDRLTADLALRLGLPWDAQLELGLPYRWQKDESVNEIGFAPTGASSRTGSGPGDVRVGIAKTLLRQGLWRPDVVGRFTWDTESGEFSDDGIFLGGGFHELRGSLTAIKRQDPVAFVGGVSYEHSVEKEQIQPGSVIGTSFGSFIALSPETSIRFVFSGAYQAETKLSGNAIAGSDRTIASFAVGGSTLLAPGTALSLSLGFGLTEDADDVSLSVSLPFRFDERLF
jgi:hypothetical protein